MTAFGQREVNGARSKYRAPFILCQVLLLLYWYIIHVIQDAINGFLRTVHWMREAETTRMVVVVYIAVKQVTGV